MLAHASHAFPSHSAPASNQPPPRLRRLPYQVRYRGGEYYRPHHDFYNACETWFNGEPCSTGTLSLLSRARRCHSSAHKPIVAAPSPCALMLGPRPCPQPSNRLSPIAPCCSLRRQPALHLLDLPQPRRARGGDPVPAPQHHRHAGGQCSAHLQRLCARPPVRYRGGEWGGDHGKGTSVTHLNAQL